MKLLPVGLSSLPGLIKENYVYVDKTDRIYGMIMTGKYYFLSRPRRFGKSLLVSTLEEILSGNRDLFKDLWIGKSGYAWKKYPVIRLDMAGVDCSGIARLEASVARQLRVVAQRHNVTLDHTESAKDLLSDLLTKLSEQAPVVILIDEYDKPILDHINNPEIADTHRAFLQNFYGVIKAFDAHIRFAFFTGVTKFTKTSIFSGLNNLADITMDTEYATMLGYTSQELEMFFAPHVALLAKQLGFSPAQAFDKLREYYDGYCFAAGAQQVYNPFSVLNCLKSLRLSDFWFATGTPTFLIKLVRHGDYGLDGILNPTVSETSLDKSDVNHIPLSTLLLQAGYLTIKTSNLATHTYTLGIPNREVNDALMEQLLDAFSGYQSESAIHYATAIYTAFQSGSMEELQGILQQFLDRMPYHTTIKDEETMRALFFIIFALIGIRVEPEVATSRGRADLVVELRDRVYIIELKVDKTAQEALAQIKDREYYTKYAAAHKQITLIGMSIDRATRKITLAHKTL